MYKYIVYSVKFQPDPIIQSNKQTFDSEDDARKHINANHSINNTHWVIIKQKNFDDVGELIDIIPKP